MPVKSRTSFALPLLAVMIALGTASTVAGADTYDVGADQPIKTLSGVPWTKLAPGDTVRVHGQPDPYREMILISTSGSQSAPVTITGVPGPHGEPAVIDGQNAVQSPDIAYHAPALTYTHGLVQVGPAKGQAWGTLPAYITIENLTICDAYKDNTFTAYNGKIVHYDPFCAGIFVEGARRLTIRGCTLVGNGLGLFVNSKNGTGGVSRDLLIDGNTIYGNGVVGQYSEHNTYTEALGTTYQNNYIGDVRPGSLGSALKDRSAGTVIRYNYIGSGGHCIDLVETQGGAGLIDRDPSYRTTYVYGNVIYNSGPSAATKIIHYGGDQYSYPMYRKGTLYFYNNTVINIANQAGPKGRWYTCLFSLPTLQESANGPVEEKVDCRNNIIYTAPNTSGAEPTDIELLDTDGTGTLDLGINWVSAGYLPFHPPYAKNFAGTVTGIENLVIGASNENPGFTDVATGNLKLASGSPCIGRGGPLNPVVLPAYAIDAQYEPIAKSIPRSGASLADLGANAAVSTATAPAARMPPTVNLNNTWITGSYPTGTTARFGVALSVRSPSPVTLKVATSDMDAASGVDYTPTTRTVTIPAGALSGVVEVPILPQTKNPLSRRFRLSIQKATGAALGRRSATATLVGYAKPPVNRPSVASSAPSAPAPAIQNDQQIAPNGAKAPDNPTNQVTVPQPSNRVAPAAVAPPVIPAPGDPVKWLSVTSSSVAAGSSVSATVHLAAVAPTPIDVEVRITGAGRMSAPSHVMVPAGSVTATFTVSAATNSPSCTTKIEAYVNGQSPAPPAIVAITAAP